MTQDHNSEARGGPRGRRSTPRTEGKGVLEPKQGLQLDKRRDDQWAGDQPTSVPSHITVPCNAGRKKPNWGTGACSHSPPPGVVGSPVLGDSASCPPCQGRRPA